MVIVDCEWSLRSPPFGNLKLIKSKEEIWLPRLTRGPWSWDVGGGWGEES